MSDREQLAALAEQFRASGLLGKPGTLSRLFDFLLERTLAGEAPKEIEIALEVFGKSPSFDVSQDAVVRVYVHKLRRRLEQFAANAPDPSHGRLIIPKGEYRLVLERPVDAAESAGAASAQTWRKSAWVWVAAALVAGIALGLAIARGWTGSGEPKELRALRANPVWAPLLDDDIPITIVVGDYYLLGETDASGNIRRLVREFFINSHRDLLDHAELDPQLVHRYRNLDLTYLPISAAHALRDIMPILGRRKRVDVALTSNLDPSVFKSTHVVYIGFISGLGNLGEPVFAASRVSPGGSFDELVDQETNTTYVSTAMPLGAESSYRDYAYFSTFAGPTGHRVLIVAGTRDAGLRQMAETLSHRDALDALTRQAGDAAQFESLYEVHGVGHTSMKTKLLFAGPMRDVNVWEAPY
jgi:hypothetical protein